MQMKRDRWLVFVAAHASTPIEATTIRQILEQSDVGGDIECFSAGPLTIALTVAAFAETEQLLSVEVIRGLYSTYKDYLVIDDQLSISDIIHFAVLMRDADPTNIRTYQIDVTGRNVSGQAVLIANDTANATAILDVFRGKMELVAISDQIPETTTVRTPATASPSATVTTVVTATPPPTGSAATIAAAEPESNAPPNALVPDPAIVC